MRNLFFALLTGVMALGLWSAQVSAQEAAPAAEQPAAAEPAAAEPAAIEPAATESAAPAQEPAEPEMAVEHKEPSEPKPTYDDYRREELERGVKRSRNALIGLSAAAVVGLPLWIAGGRTQCVSYEDGSGNTQTDCTTAGKVMLGIGYPLAIGGLTGALISGIILGVRKGKLRDLEARTKYSNSKRLHWDPYSSRFVF